MVASFVISGIQHGRREWEDYALFCAEGEKAKPRNKRRSILDQINNMDEWKHLLIGKVFMHVVSYLQLRGPVVQSYDFYEKKSDAFETEAVWNTFLVPRVAGDHSWDSAIKQLLHKMLVSFFPFPSMM